MVIEMTYQEIEMVVKNIIIEMSPEDISIEEINVDSLLIEDLMFDSLLFIEYILALEEAFDIIIDEDMLELENFECVTATVKYLLGRISKSSN